MSTELLTTEMPLQPPSSGEDYPSPPATDDAHDLLLEFAGAAIGSSAMALLLLCLWCAKRHPGVWAKLLACITCHRYTPTRSEVQRGASRIRRMVQNEPFGGGQEMELESTGSAASLRFSRRLEAAAAPPPSPEYVIPVDELTRQQNASAIYAVPDDELTQDELTNLPGFVHEPPPKPPRVRFNAIGESTLLRLEIADPPLTGRARDPKNDSAA